MKVLTLFATMSVSNIRVSSTSAEGESELSLQGMSMSVSGLSAFRPRAPIKLSNLTRSGQLVSGAQFAPTHGYLQKLTTQIIRYCVTITV